MNFLDKLTGHDQRKRAEEERRALERARIASLGRAQQSSNPAVAQRATQKLNTQQYNVAPVKMPSLYKNLTSAVGTVANNLDFNANSNYDRQKRMRQGMPELYQDQQRANGNMRPNMNAGQAFVGNTARFLNTANAAGREVQDTTKMYSAQLTNNPTAYRNAQAENYKFKNTAYQPNSGLLGAGTIFNNPGEFNTLGAKDLSKRIGATTVGTAGEVIPVGKGFSLANKGANATIGATTKLVGQGALAGGMGSVGNQQIQYGRVDPKQVAIDAALGGITTGAIGYAGSKLPIAAKATTKIASQVPEAVQKFDNKLTEVANPAIKSLRANREDAVRAFERETNPRVREQINRYIAQVDGELGKLNRGGGGGEPIKNISPMKSAPKQQNILTDNKVVENQRVRDFTSEYASMLKQIDDGATGGQLQKVNDGTSGGTYTRTSEHSPFYRKVYAETGKPPTKAMWQKEAQRQLESGNGDAFAIDEYRKLVNEVNTNPEVQSMLDAADRGEFRTVETGQVSSPEVNIKVKEAKSERIVPVTKQTQQGDIVVKSQVNPSRKYTEKRFTVDNEGKLIEDRKGAYRLFSDDEGHIKGIRIGDEYYDAKETLGNLADVNDYGSALATQRRNIERSFGKETADKVQKFLVDDQQARATQMITRHIEYKKGLQALADDLGISFKIGRGKAKKVSAAIQDFGEGNRTKQSLVDEFGADYANKIVTADKWFKGNYEKLLNEANETLVKYGYDPIPKRKNYYTHFQDENVWKSFGLKMQEIRNFANPTMQDATTTPTRGKVNNALAGQTEFTVPNKKWNPFAQQRKGGAYTSSAFEAFERYLNPTLNNIYMTPSITRARVIARAVAQEADLAGKDANGIIIQTREWANRLAGKSNRFDRPIVDSKAGQKYLKAAQWMQKKAGQNTIVGNLATAVMQPVVVTQASGRFGYKNTLLAAMQEMSTTHTSNAPIRQSEFLNRRYADLAPVTSGKTDKARGYANKPLEVIEQGATRITWQAAYNDALSKGMKGKQAIKYADIETEKTVAGRSIGEKPEMFESKAAGPLTMYGLEVSNYWQQVGKEMIGNKNFAQAGRVFAAAYAFNLLLQELTGRQVGFNPIDVAIDSYEETQKDKPLKDKAIAIGQRVLGEGVDNTPFVGPIVNTAIGDRKLRDILGNSSNTGRFGVSSPIGAITSTTNVGGIPIPQNVILPFAGNQAKKTYEGLTAFAKGKVEDKNGKTLVEIPKTPTNLAKATIFGKNAIKEVDQYNTNIGLKKVDQKPVQNQTNSRAASQGPDTVMKNTKLTLDQAKDIQKKEYGGKYKDLSSDEIKELAKTDPEAAKYKKSYDATVAAYGATPDLPTNLNDSAKKVIERSSRLTSEGTTKWNKLANNDKTIQTAITSWLPDKSRPPKITNEVAKMWAEYEKSIADGSTNKIEADSKKRSIITSAYKSELDDLTKSFYSLGDDAMKAELEKGTITQAQMDKVIEIDNVLTSMGMQKYSQVGKKLRSALGYGLVGGSSGGSGGGGRGGKPSFTSVAISKQANSPRYVTVAPVKKAVFKRKSSRKSFKNVA
jgi:hypothetical protein